MKRMPMIIKNKLRQLDRASRSCKKINNELMDLFRRYDIDIDYLMTTNEDIYSDNPSTEALTNIDYGEGDLELSIEEIEKVFLFQINANKERKVTEWEK